MLTADLIFAWIHFLGAFALMGALFAQMSLLSAGIASTAARRLARLDIVYLAAAVTVLLGGLARVFHGARGAAYYMDNPAFHLKVTLFVLIALISIWPTVSFIKWRRAQKADPGFVPDAKAVKRVKMLVHIEATLATILILTASVMARYYAL